MRRVLQVWSHSGLGRNWEQDGGGQRDIGYGAMLKDNNVISSQISTAGIMQQIGWIGSSSIRTVRTSVPVHGVPGIRGVRVTPAPPAPDIREKKSGKVLRKSTFSLLQSCSIIRS